MAKAERLVALIWLLQSRGRSTAQELATALSVDVRTIYRYMQKLSEAGVPVVSASGPDGGYSLLESFHLAPLYFSPDEARALSEALHLADAASPSDAAALSSARQKIEQTLPPDLRQHLERLRESTRVDFWRPVPRDTSERIRPMLSEAITGQRKIEVMYRTPGTADPLPRTLDPYGLFFQGSSWLLIAHCHLRGAVRSFRLDRIVSARLLAERFLPPEDLDLDSYRPERWVPRRIATAELTEVKIAGSPAALQALSEHWYLRHCHPRLAAGDVLHLQVDPIGLRHVSRELLVNTEVDVLSPDTLRRSIAALGATLSRRYQRAR